MEARTGSSIGEPEGGETSAISPRHGVSGGLTLRAAQEVRWDLVSLGEVMLRFDPGEERITRTRNFRVWEGGGEYNVARGLRRCFGKRTAIVTALADNPVGRLLEDLMLEGGVDLSHVLWTPYDQVGRESRNGVYFLERGHGVQGRAGDDGPGAHGDLAGAAGAGGLGCDLCAGGVTVVSYGGDHVCAFSRVAGGGEGGDGGGKAEWGGGEL